MMMLSAVLISCKTTRTNDCYYPFPELEEATRTDDGEKITVYDSDGKPIFIYDSVSDMVSVTRNYWLKIITYGINTGGLTSGNN